MVHLSTAVEEGHGYLHLIPSDEMDERDDGLKLFYESYCGESFDGHHVIPATEAGEVTFKDLNFDPEDLADLILRLRRDGYMCRECVREHFEAVGGIPGLYHDKWTEDLHREESIEDPKDLKPVREAVEIEGDVTVMAVGDGLEDSQVRVSGQCPRCDDGLHVRTSVIKPRPGGRDLRVGVACTSCTWSRDVDLQP